MKKKPASKKAAKKKPVGRPTKRGLRVERVILEGLGNGIPLSVICAPDKMPSLTSVWTWRDKDPVFSEAIARARERGFDKIAADCLKIADTQELGEVVKDGINGVEITRADMLGHRKLQIETRLKLLAKWDPKRYGDKLDVEHSGSVDVEITIGGDDSE